MKNKFLIRQVEAWYNECDGWTYNQTWNIGEMITRAKDEKRAFTNYLKKQGIVFKSNRTLIDFDGNNYTIIDRKTKEPYFDAVYVEQ